MNQFFFEKILVLEGEVGGAILADPFPTLLSEEFVRKLGRRSRNPDRGAVSSGAGLKMSALAPLIEQTSNPLWAEQLRELTDFLRKLD